MINKLAQLLADADGQINNDLPTVEQVAEYLIAHGVVLKEESGTAEMLKNCQKRIENQRSDIRKLKKTLVDVKQSRNAWKDKAERLGKELFEIYKERAKHET